MTKTNWDFVFKWIGGCNPTEERWYPIHDISKLVPADIRIQFYERLPHDEFVAAVTQANIILSPSRREGCPMVLVEAMCVGCITLVADYDVANKELVKDGITGFVIGHNDIDRFVNVIGKIVKNPEAYESFYDASFQMFQAELSFETWKFRMNDVIANDNCQHVQRKNGFNEWSYSLWRIRFRLAILRDLAYRLIIEKIPTLYKLLKLKQSI